MLYTEKDVINLLRQKSESKDLEIYIFGSRVWGTPNEYSDIDIAVKGNINEVIDLSNSIEDIVSLIPIDMNNFEFLDIKLKERILKDGIRIK